VPSHATERRDPLGESQLEILLGELLDKGGSETPRADIEAPREIVELREAARRLRAASQWMPLPDGRFAVRRALLATAEQSQTHTGPGRASWRRAGLWLSMAAVAAVVVGAFGLGAGALSALLPPSSPASGLRLALDKARAAFAFGHLGPVQYALRYQFAAIQGPFNGGESRTVDGKIGGLPVTLALTAADACTSGEPCGKFVVSVARLSAPASAQFGELKGTFACASSGCTLTMAEATGVFVKVSEPHMAVSGTRASEGQLGAKFASLGEWVTMVASAAETLETSGMLPTGLTVADLVSGAATNERGVHRNGGPQGIDKKSVPNTSNPSGKQGSMPSINDTHASGSRGTSSTTGTRGGASVGVNLDHGMSSPGNLGGPTVHSSAGVNAGSSSHGTGSSEATIPRSTGVDVGVSHHGVGSTIDAGTDIRGGASIGSGELSVDGSTSIGAGGVSGGAGTSVSGGASIGAGGVSVAAGTSVSGGVSVGAAGVSGGAGTSVSGGASTGTGGVSGGAGASVSGGPSTGTGGVSAGAGASVSGGTSTSAGGVSAGAGASVSGGASAGAAGVSAAGASVSGGASTSAGGVSVGAGGVSISGGTGGTGGGGSGGGSGHDAGSGNH